MRDEFLDPQAVNDTDHVDDVGLRPRRLAEFVGQSELKEHLSIVLEAAKKRGQPADHLLLAGPPGLGKTSRAGIVAAEMGVHLHITS
ncbi:MAG: Holliday junction branch migration helicase RuvB, partial [Actinomycetota bacterium]